MDNHFHLMIAPQPNLSRGMRQLNGVNPQRFNRRHRKIGHLFQGRFKAILVERESDLLELCRYVAFNPVRAKTVNSTQDYVWSSYRATLRLESSLSDLSTDWLLGQFARTKPAARRRYASFVLAGVGQSSPWQELKGQVMLGSESFVENLALKLKSSAPVPGITKRQRLLHCPSIKKLRDNTTSRKERNLAMAKAHLEYGYTLAEIGIAAQLHYATVGRIIISLEKMSQFKMCPRSVQDVTPICDAITPRSCIPSQ